MSSPQNNENMDHPPPNEEEYEEDIFRAIDANDLALVQRIISEPVSYTHLTLPTILRV